MGKRRSTQDAELEKIYAQIPDVHCKGLCQYACTAIDMTRREDARIRAAGVDITPHQQAVKQMQTTGDYTCEALTAQGRCSVYEIRPTVCRAWGATEALACAYGCAPEGGWLTYAQTLELLNAASRVGGDQAHSVAPGVHTSTLERKPELARALEDAARAAHISPIRSPFRRNP